MGFILLFPLLTFFGLKFGHYIFLIALRSLWYLLYFGSRRLWELTRPIGIANHASSSGSGSNIGVSAGSGISGSSTSSGAMPSISAGQIASSPRHSLAQFLNNILSMRGPNNLPYEEDVKYYIRQHLLALTKEFMGLQIKTATFNHNDGRTSYLLQAGGTIPMFYREVKYNIPVTMWLVDAYPRIAPLVFVTPTRDMIIKPHHRYVDASGSVNVPYLMQWTHPRSNLVELAHSLSTLFGEDPPLYAQRADPERASQPVPTTPSPRAATQHVQSTNPLHSRGGSGLNSPAQSGSPEVNHRPPPYTVNPSTPGSSSRLATQPLPPEEVFRVNAINTLTDRLERDTKASSKRGAIEMDDLFNKQVSLNQRKQMLEDGVRDLRREKEALEEQLQVFSTNTDVIETWLRHNDVDQPELLVDDVFPPVDGLSRQLLDCTAADLAIDDLMYSLDRAVQDGSVPWEAYHKTTRQLSREQFYYRATCLKIRAVQINMQVERMAGRAEGNYQDPSTAHLMSH